MRTITFTRDMALSSSCLLRAGSPMSVVDEAKWQLAKVIGDGVLARRHPRFRAHGPWLNRQDPGRNPRGVGSWKRRSRIEVETQVGHT
jgi:hypothetical protein